MSGNRIEDNEDRSSLKVKTRGNSSPQGKARVFFAGLRDGFDKFFEEISDDILRCQNCAIYYPDSDDTMLREDDLMSIQLFVVLVTDSLFAGDNYVTEKILPFCKQNHKPILPVMCENGCPDEFNELFDQMQYLDPFTEDSTAVSYQTKLEKYLDSVLISDELAARVRDAFDAYVFLSYRKKDREYAQKLMRLIHSNESCRDIAIWYDEFLVPGHSFSKSIEEAFKKSDLFALVVTPSLLEEGNYVMEVEYKMATDSDTAVMPAELKETDRKKLEEYYPGIPPCVSVDEPERISSSLLDALRSEALMRNSGDPQHDFFIGLAYLDGIDVEVDTSRAYDLIKSAADKKLPEAIEKMVFMLRNGEAVERDLQEAISWQRMLTDVYKEAFEKDPDKYLEYAGSLENLANYAYELELTDEAKEVWNTILEISPEPPFWGARYRQLAHRMLGDIAMEDDMDQERAAYHYGISMELMRNLSEEASTVGTWSELSLNCYSTGLAMKRNGDTEKAEKLFRHALEINKTLLKDADDSNVIAEARKNCIRMHTAIAEICAAKGETGEAEEMYEKALSLARVMHDEYGSAHTGRDLLITLNRLGDYQQFTLKNADRAEEYYTEAFSLTREQYQNTLTPGAKEDYAFSLNRLGEAALAKGSITEALEHFKESFDILSDLADAAPTAGNRGKAAAASEKMSEALKAIGRDSEAYDYMLKTIDIRNDVAEETRSMTERRNLAINLILKGNEDLQKDRLADAEESYRKAADLRRAIFEESESDEAKSQVAFAYSKLGTLYRKMRLEDKAMEYFEMAKDLGEELVTEDEDPEKLRSLFVDNLKLGEGLEAQGKLEEAQEYYNKILPMAEKIMQLAPGAQATRDHYLCLIKSADIAYKRHEYEKARDLYSDAKERAERLYDETHSGDTQYDNAYLDQQLRFVREDIESGGTLEEPVYADNAATDMESLLKLMATLMNEAQESESDIGDDQEETYEKGEEPAKKKWFEFWKS